VSDIVSRLRGWRCGDDAVILVDEAADEIERLRADWPEQLTASSVLIAEQSREIDRLRQVLSQQNLTLASEESEQRDVGTELVLRVTHLNEVLEENVRLREAIRRLADQDATLAVQGGNVIVEMDATLTREEREAVESAMNAYGEDNADPECAAIEATLYGLLERL